MRYCNDIPVEWFDGRAKWIWSGEGVWGASPDPRPVQTRYFARPFDCAAGQRFALAITADSRYLLYLNGRVAARGPQTGDIDHHYYDVLEFDGELRGGENLLVVRVDSYARSFPYYKRTGPPAGIMSAAGVFAADAVILERDGAIATRFFTDGGWRVMVDPAFAAGGDEEVGSYVGYKEKIDFRLLPTALLSRPDFDSPGWAAATEVHTAFTPGRVRDGFLPHRLLPRSIEPHRHAQCGFRSATWKCGPELPHAFDAEGSFSLVVPPRTHVSVILDAGVERTGYPELVCRDGAGARIQLRYAEKLVRKNEPRYFGAYDPACRLDGYSDTIVCGNGHGIWTPIHWRALRYLEVAVTTADEPLAIDSLRLDNVHYPIFPVAPFSASDPALARFWENGIRTLQCCAHDVFEDCPYFEQMQYGGDTQVQALFAYWLSGDTALARQAIRFFHWSRGPEGLVLCRYPTRSPTIIPHWALHYLFMLYDWYLYTGDARAIREEIFGAMNDLRWFIDRRDRDGLVGKLPYYCVADWSPEWRRDFGGTVPGSSEGPTALTNFMVVAALEKVGELLTAIGEQGLAGNCRAAAAGIRSAAPRVFWDDERGVYRDSPLHSVASQLTNAWALLIDLPPPERRAALAGAIDSDAQLCQAAFLGHHFVFEAWTRNGRQDLVLKHFKAYRAMIAMGLTTWPEAPGNTRSQCHAWSNAATFHLLRTILGFEIAAPGCSRIACRPYAENLDHFAGGIATPRGPVMVDYDRGRRNFYRIKVPAGVEVAFAAGDQTRALTAGEHEV